MANLELGSTVGSYRIESVAGRGGMGVVYIATQIRLNRLVALKVITPDLAEDAGFRERFVHESQMAASIDHPNVIPVYEAGEDDGLLYLSMRYVEGTDLGRLLREQGRLEASRAAHIVAQVADALDAAHARGLVHRDVKPANILIAAGDRTYLTDFGLTKHAESSSGLTKTGTWVGTVDYVAPEQIQAQHVDARSDVYALGCVLFHALAGQIPFPRPSEIAKIYAHLQDDPPAVDWAALGVPAAMDAVVRRAMAKEPAERYPSAGDLGRAGVAAAEQRPVTQPERTVAAGAAAPGTGATILQSIPPTGTGATQALPPSPPPSTYPPGQYAPTYAQQAPPSYAPPPAYGPPPSYAQAPGPPSPPRRSSRTTLIVLGVVLLLAGAGVGIAAAAGVFSGAKTNTVVTQVTTGGTGTATTDTGTQTTEGGTTVPASAVRDVLREYEAAYSNEDIGTLDSLFTQDFKRRAPPKPDMGRAAALAEYQSQFAQLSSPTYTLSNVSIQTGSGGATATADYEITDSGGAPATGTIAFGLVESGGSLKIDAIDVRSG